ncbi:MAG: hypothetical protein L3J89_08265 [Gammaproteobacteria bacterium]|nr:hypothetical protein [Gammaproteobacteria bacterium]
MKTIFVGITLITTTAGYQALHPSRCSRGYTAVAEQKQHALNARYEKSPERFVKGRPEVKLPPEFVAINPISTDESDEMLADCVNFPTLTAAGYVRDRGKEMLSKN